MTDRPDWDVYYMQLAFSAATRASCPRRSTGAVIVQRGRVIATGYNGAPSGADHCPTDDKAGHPDCMENGHCVRAVHAETNAILACASGGASTEGATLYCTTFPCTACMGTVINAGIVEIVYAQAYSDPTHRKNYQSISFGMAVRANIKVRAIVFDVDQDALRQTLTRISLQQPSKA